LKKVSPKNLPTRLPFLFSAVIWLLLDRFQASDLISGIVYTLLAIIWIGALVGLHQEKHCDIDQLL
jgi:multisubunit Na+/H+ antiporter MnhE subunit